MYILNANKEHINKCIENEFMISNNNEINDILLELIQKFVILKVSQIIFR